MSFKKNDKVRFVAPTISGVVVGAKLTADDELLYTVRWTDDSGQVQERSFRPDELELAPGASA